MQVYPLKCMTLEEAIDQQFHIVDCITNEFEGIQFLTNGDIGDSMTSGGDAVLVHKAPVYPTTKVSFEMLGLKIIEAVQSRVILVEFDEDIAEAVLQAAEVLGGAPYPVGAESKYEIIPMFYRVSGTFLAYDSGLAKRMIRINPMRAGEDTVRRILKQAVERVVACS